MTQAKANGKAVKPPVEPPKKQGVSWMVLDDGTQIGVSSVKGTRFKQNIRKQGKARIGIYGVPGSGKTKSAMEIAQGLGDRICMIDTDLRSWHYGVQYPSVQVEELIDQSPEAWIELVYAAEAEGYEVVICDTFSDAWAGQNGLLEVKGKIAAEDKKLDNFSAWDVLNPIQRRLLNALLVHSNMHIICTFRTKVEYEMVPNGKGGTKIQAVGLGPVWRNGIESYFDFFGQITEDHVLTWSKEMHYLFSGASFDKPTSEVGATIKAWAEEGTLLPWRVEAHHQQTLRELMTAKGWTIDLTRNLLNLFKIAKFEQLPGRNSYLLLRQCLGMHPELGMRHAQECVPKLPPDLPTSEVGQDDEKFENITEF